MNSILSVVIREINMERSEVLVLNEYYNSYIEPFLGSNIVFNLMCVLGVAQSYSEQGLHGCL